MLCHKPNQLETIGREIAAETKAVASVLGSGTIAALQAAYPNTPVFRLMPNTPVEVRRGIVCYAAALGVPDELAEQVTALFARLGTVVPLEERLIDTAGAVMGVTPAYYALVAEAQVDAAVRHGLGAAIAAALVTGTMAGTAALLEARDYDTLAVRREVTSPGGSTARGLAALERGGLRSAFQAAIDAVVQVGGSDR